MSAGTIISKTQCFLHGKTVKERLTEPEVRYEGPYKKVLALSDQLYSWNFTPCHAFSVATDHLGNMTDCESP